MSAAVALCPGAAVPSGTVPNDQGDTVATTGKTAKTAAQPTPDEVLLAEQAEEEAAAVAEAIEPAEATAADENATLAEMRAQLERELVEARVQAELAGKLGMLKRIYLGRYGHVFAGSDDALLEGEEELLAAAPASSAQPPATDLAAILAANNATMMAAVEMLVDKLKPQGGGHQVSLTGDAGSLIAELAGTVTDGGPGESPLDDPVTFISRGANFRAVKKPRFRRVDPDGSQGFSQGVQADFSPHGSWTTTNPEMVEWLKSRPGFNVDFWELGAEPHSAPDPSKIMGKILDATLSLDDDALAELERLEVASHNRKVVVDAVRAARNRVQRFNAAASQEA